MAGNRIALGSALLLFALSAIAAQPELFQCKTASGRMIASNVPPAECSDREIRVFSYEGKLSRVIRPQLPATNEKIQSPTIRVDAPVDLFNLAEHFRDLTSNAANR